MREVIRIEEPQEGIKPVPEIVKEYVLKTCGRMPETDKEIDDYLDLINHAKEYSAAFAMEQILGKSGMKRLGFKTPAEIKKQFKGHLNSGKY